MKKLSFDLSFFQKISNSNRCHMAAGSSTIEMAYVILQSDIRKASEMPEKVRVNCTGADDNTTIVTFYKARFQFKVPTTFKGYNIGLFFRWANIHYPELAGNWGLMQTVPIV
jgi:hypothetical protein